MAITPAQSRAARAMLDLKQVDIAEAADLSESTVRDFEKGRRVPSVNALKALQAAFVERGAVFLDAGEMKDGGPGVRLRNS